MRPSGSVPPQNGQPSGTDMFAIDGISPGDGGVSVTSSAAAGAEESGNVALIPAGVGDAETAAPDATVPGADGGSVAGALGAGVAAVDEKPVAAALAAAAEAAPVSAAGTVSALMRRSASGASETFAPANSRNAPGSKCGDASSASSLSRISWSAMR